MLSNRKLTDDEERVKGDGLTQERDRGPRHSVRRLVGCLSCALQVRENADLST